MLHLPNIVSHHASPAPYSQLSFIRRPCSWKIYHQVLLLPSSPLLSRHESTYPLKQNWNVSCSIAHLFISFHPKTFIHSPAFGTYPYYSASHITAHKLTSNFLSTLHIGAFQLQATLFDLCQGLNKYALNLD